jgi:hypothetical protein
LHSPAYLCLSRHHIYYVRWPLPKKLHPFGIQSFVKVSLKTRDPAQALLICRSISYVAHLIVTQGLAHGMRYDEIRKLLNNYFVEAIRRSIDRIAENGRLTDEEIELYKQGAAYGTLAYIVKSEGSPQLKSFFDWSGLKVKEGSKDHETISTEYEGAYSEFCQRLLDYDKSLVNYAFSAPIGVSAIALGTEHAKQTSLHELINVFVNEQVEAKIWRGKSELDKRHHYALLEEILGSEFQIAKYTEDDALRVKGVVLKLPTNRNKKEATRNLSLNELIAIDHSHKLSTKTRNQYLMSYSSLFSWAKRHRYVSENYFEGFHIKAKKLGAKEKRLSFEPSQIAKMLHELTSNEGGLIKKPYQKWGPLIAIYTGARLNEIAQLELGDIKTEDGINYFDLNESTEDKRLKNEASARKVPIHSQLIKLGLMDYVE